MVILEVNENTFSSSNILSAMALNNYRNTQLLLITTIISSPQYTILWRNLSTENISRSLIANNLREDFLLTSMEVYKMRK